MSAPGITASGISHASAGRGRIAIARPGERVLAAVIAITLGMVLVYTVGFARPHALHNAAQDARHAFTFPCH